MADEKKSFWSSMPGLITGIAAILTGLAALVPIILNVTGKGSTKHTGSSTPGVAQSASPGASAGSGGTFSPSPEDTSGSGSTESPGSSAGSALAAAQSTQDWGQLSVNSSPQQRTVTFTNQGSSGITIDNVQITGSQASSFGISSTNCGSGTALDPGASCDVAVTYKPALGSQSASLVVTSHPPHGASTKVALTGKGTLL
jgi:hypothetical protein